VLVIDVTDIVENIIVIKRHKLSQPISLIILSLNINEQTSVINRERVANEIYADIT